MKRAWLIVMGVVAAGVTIAACGGKVDLDGLTTGGTTGTGGSTSTSSSSSSSTSNSTSSSGNGSSSGSSTSSGVVGSSSGSSGTTGCDPTFHCAQAIQAGIPAQKPLCTGSSSDNLYNAFVACMCAGGGACTTACASSICIGLDSTDTCKMCEGTGCSQQFTACENDM